MFRCQTCSKTFNYQASLKLHQKSHRSSQNYKCPHPQCNEQYLLKSALTKHLKVAHGVKKRVHKCKKPPKPYDYAIGRCATKPAFDGETLVISSDDESDSDIEELNVVSAEEANNNKKENPNTQENAKESDKDHVGGKSGEESFVMVSDDDVSDGTEDTTADSYSTKSSSAQSGTLSLSSEPKSAAENLDSREQHSDVEHHPLVKENVHGPVEENQGETRKGISGQSHKPVVQPQSDDEIDENRKEVDTHHNKQTDKKEATSTSITNLQIQEPRTISVDQHLHNQEPRTKTAVRGKEHESSQDIGDQAIENTEDTSSNAKGKGDQASNFLCQICKKELSTKVAFDLHMNIHERLKSVKSSDSANASPNAKTENSPQRTIFRCEKCNMQFVRKVLLDAHTRRHDGTFRYPCSKCSLGFDTPTRLQIHSRIHEAKKQIVGGSSRDDTNEHGSDYEGDDVDSNCCQSCGKIFSSYRGMKIHLARFCKYSTSSGKKENAQKTANRDISKDISGLQVLQTRHEENNTLHAVEELTDDTQQEDDHENVIEESLNEFYNCISCTRRFSTERGMKIHSARCKKSNPDSGDMHENQEPDWEKQNSHEYLEDGESGMVQYYTCKFCQLNFSTERGMKVHLARCSQKDAFGSDLEIRSEVDRHDPMVENNSPVNCSDPVESGFNSSLCFEETKCDIIDPESEKIKEEDDENKKDAQESMDTAETNYPNSAETDTAHPTDTDAASLPSQSILHIHRTNQQELKYRYECRQCTQIFNTKAYLSQHVKYVHRAATFSCNICHKRFANKYSCARHTNRHYRIERYQCHVCEKLFRLKETLESHMNIMHYGTDSYRCQTCEQSFSQKTALRNHVALCLEGSTMRDSRGSSIGVEYQGEEGNVNLTPSREEEAQDISDMPHTSTEQNQDTNNTTKQKLLHFCEVFAKSFKQTGQMTESSGSYVESPSRTRMKHSPVMFPCTECHQLFTTQASCRMHMKSHNKVQAYKCLVCEKLFLHEQNLDRHMACHEKSQENMLGAEQQNSLDLIQENPLSMVPEKTASGVRENTPNTMEGQHMKTAHNSQGITCSVCHKGFASKQSCKVHMDSVHYGIKFNCQHCGKAFSQKWWMKIHASKCKKINAIPDHIDRNNEISSLQKEASKLNPVSTDPIQTKQAQAARCHLCQKTFKTQQSLKTHFAIHSGILPFKCPTCERSFSQKGAMKTHAAKCKNINPTHSPVNTFKCPTCKKTFSQKWHMKLHYSRCSNRGKVPEKVAPDKLYRAGAPEGNRCSMCEKTFQKKTGLYQHIKVVHQPHQFYCDFCSKTFAIRQSLQTHMANYHSAPKPFKCLTCEKSFVHRWIMKAHQVKCSKKGTKGQGQNEHNHQDESNVDTFNANVGVAHATTSEPQCQTNQDGVIENTLPNLECKLSFSCTVCSKAFPNKYRLDAHMACHTESLHKCTQCTKTFKHKTSLLAHMMVHKESRESFSCANCEKTFSTKGNYEIHMKIHSGEKLFHCRICSKSFSQKGNLSTHMKIHTQEKAHKCDKCLASFIQKKDLDLHMERHAAYFLYHCSVCQLGYNTQLGLKQHMLQKHGIVSL